MIREFFAGGIAMNQEKLKVGVIGATAWSVSVS